MMPRPLELIELEGAGVCSWPARLLAPRQSSRSPTVAVEKPVDYAVDKTVNNFVSVARNASPELTADRPEQRTLATPTFVMSRLRAG